MYISVGHVKLTHWTKKWICTKRALWCKNWKCKLRRKSGANMPHLPPNFHWAVSKLHRIYFKTTVSILRLFVSPVQIQCPSLYVNQALFLIQTFFQSNKSIFLAALEVKCAWYLHSLPIHLFISLFPVICFELPITTRTFFDFPRRFELSGVNCR